MPVSEGRMVSLSSLLDEEPATELDHICKKANIGLGPKTKEKLRKVKSFSDLLKNASELDRTTGAERDLLKVIEWYNWLKDRNDGEPPNIFEDFTEEAFEEFKQQNQTVEVPKKTFAGTYLAWKHCKEAQKVAVENGCLPDICQEALEQTVSNTTPQLKKAIRNKLLEEISRTYISAIVEDDIKTSASNSDIVLVAGRTQSGKSAVKVAGTLACREAGVAQAVITKGMRESKELVNKIRGYVSGTQNERFVTGFSSPNLEGVNKKIEVDSVLENNGTVVAFDSQAQINRLKNSLLDRKEKNPNFKYILVVDECDAVICRSEGRTYQIEKAFDELLRVIHPTLLVLVSATPFPVLWELAWRGSLLKNAKISQVFNIEPSEDYSGIEDMEPLKDKSGRPVYVSSKDYNPKNSYTSVYDEELYRDALEDRSKQGVLILDCTNPRVNTDGHVGTKAEKMQHICAKKFGRDVVVVINIGRGIEIKEPGEGWSIVSHDKDVGDVISYIDKKYTLKTPISCFGFSKMSRGCSYRSDDRVPTHMIVNLGPGHNIQNVTQTIGRATFNGKKILKKNGFQNVTLLTSMHDFIAAKKLQNYLDEFCKRAKGGKITLSEALTGVNEAFPDTANFLRHTPRPLSRIKCHGPKVRDNVNFGDPPKKLEGHELVIRDAHFNDERSQKVLGEICRLAGRFASFCLEDIEQGCNDTYFDDDFVIKKADVRKTLNTFVQDVLIQKVDKEERVLNRRKTNGVKKLGDTVMFKVAYRDRICKYINPDLALTKSELEEYNAGESLESILGLARPSSDEEDYDVVEDVIEGTQSADENEDDSGSYSDSHYSNNDPLKPPRYSETMEPLVTNKKRKVPDTDDQDGKQPTSKLSCATPKSKTHQPLTQDDLTSEAHVSLEQLTLLMENADSGAQATQLLTRAGFVVSEMKGDGNCLFRSLSDQINKDGGAGHKSMRRKCCAYIQKNRDDFPEVTVQDENNAKSAPEHFKNYLDGMKKKGQWGGESELKAAANVLRRHIHVFCSGTRSLKYSPKENPLEPDIYLLFDKEGLHYDSVYQDKRPEKQHRERAKIYYKWKNENLRAKCRDNRLPVSGPKADLVRRLCEFEAGQGQDDLNTSRMPHHNQAISPSSLSKNANVASQSPHPRTNNAAILSTFPQRPVPQQTSILTFFPKSTKPSAQSRDDDSSDNLQRRQEQPQQQTREEQEQQVAILPCLTNIGNSCYMNVALHLFHHIIDQRRLFEMNMNPLIQRRGEFQARVTLGLLDVVKDMMGSPRNIRDKRLHNLRKALFSDAPFQGGIVESQQDASEALGVFLNAIFATCDDQDPGNSIGTLLGIAQANVAIWKTCKNCNARNYMRNENHAYFQVPISDGKPLSYCLKTKCFQSHLEIQCNLCGRQRHNETHVVQEILTNQPKYLILSLVLFENSGANTRKSKKQIVLDDFVTVPFSGGSPLVYKPTYIAMHHGKTREFGHYNCVRYIHECWYLFNDSDEPVPVASSIGELITYLGGRIDEERTYLQDMYIIVLQKCNAATHNKSQGDLMEANRGTASNNNSKSDSDSSDDDSTKYAYSSTDSDEDFDGDFADETETSTQRGGNDRDFQSAERHPLPRRSLFNEQQEDRMENEEDMTETEEDQIENEEDPMGGEDDQIEMFDSQGPAYDFGDDKVQGGGTKDSIEPTRLFGGATTANSQGSYGIGHCSLGVHCRNPTQELRQRYRCDRCCILLHNSVFKHACSVPVDEDGQIIRCPVGFGCRTNEPSGPQPPPLPGNQPPGLNGNMPPLQQPVPAFRPQESTTAASSISNESARSFAPGVASITDTNVNEDGSAPSDDMAQLEKKVMKLKKRLNRRAEAEGRTTMVPHGSTPTKKRRAAAVTPNNAQEEVPNSSSMRRSEKRRMKIYLDDESLA